MNHCKDWMWQLASYLLLQQFPTTYSMKFMFQLIFFNINSCLPIIFVYLYAYTWIFLWLIGNTQSHCSQCTRTSLQLKYHKIIYHEEKSICTSRPFASFVQHSITYLHHCMRLHFLEPHSLYMKILRIVVSKLHSKFQLRYS
jgi:hypothetical protein